MNSNGYFPITYTKPIRIVETILWHIYTYSTYMSYSTSVPICPQYFEGYLDYKYTTRNTRNKTYLWDKSNTSYGPIL